MEEVNPCPTICEKISELCFKCKDMLIDCDSFEILSTRKNLVTKICSVEKGNHPPFVFLFSSSYLDTNRMKEVVSGCLMSVGKKCTSDTNVDTEFARGIAEFLIQNNRVEVRLVGDSISVFGEKSGFGLLFFQTEGIDESAKQMFARSACMLLAYCGNTVKNNIDDIILNDYGVANIDSQSSLITILPDEEET
jgi:hypothetical protein